MYPAIKLDVSTTTCIALRSSTDLAPCGSTGSIHLRMHKGCGAFLSSGQRFQCPLQVSGKEFTLQQRKCFQSL